MTSAALWFLVVIAAYVLVFHVFQRLHCVARLLLPMWLPLAVLIVAGFALFGTEQGRDLGIGLLGTEEDRASWLTRILSPQLVLLALALFYWATGSWHAARLGLNRAFGTDRARWPAGFEPWLRWLPKLVGACAHFFAALSLALAARHVIPPDQTLLFVPLWLIGFVPPAVIAVGVFILWRLDQRYVAARNAWLKLKASGNADPAARADYEAARSRMRRTISLIIAVGLALAAALYPLGAPLPNGLAPATAWVMVSAALFLLLVSYRKAIGEWVLSRQSVSSGVKDRLTDAFKETDERHALSSLILASALSLIAVLVAAWAWWDAVLLGAATGAMVLGFFAFGAYIAVIDLIRMLARTGTRFALVCTFLLLLAVGTSMTRDFHPVRLCSDGEVACGGASAAAGSDAAGDWSDPRPTVADAARAWHAQASREWSGDGPVPMLIVATAGGGMRAAYWTATVLEELEHKLGGKDVLRRHLFAISGVSGGSIGALAYMAARSDDAPPDLSPTGLLQRDFLAPAIAALAFVDGPSSLLPDLQQRDRSYALEHAWERASDGILARPFLSFSPSDQELQDGAPWRPALLLNATHQDTGRRVVTSHLRVDSSVFLDSFDAHALMAVDMPASTAGHNSARFSYLSPAGKLVPPHPKPDGPRDYGFLLDGGYFENYGAITALQLLREAERTLEGRAVQPIILQISSDPSLISRDRAQMKWLCEATPGVLEFDADSDRVRTYANELTAPIAGVLASRVAHGTLAAQELGHHSCRLPQQMQQQAPSAAQVVAEAKPETGVISAGTADGASPSPVAPHYAHLAMCDEDGSILPPLGWVLSSLVRSKFPEILEQCRNPNELEVVTSAFAGAET